MKQDLLCMTCQSVGQPKTITRGSFWIEILLWLCMLFPGVIYTIWRLTSRYNGCRTCGGTALVPMNSPAAQKMLGA